MTLGDKEKEHGLTYVAVSCVRRLRDIGLYDGISFNRLCWAIKKNAKSEPCISEEGRLHRLCKETIKFVSNRGVDMDCDESDSEDELVTGFLV